MAKKNKLFYLCYYDTPSFSYEKRHYYVSAAVKISEICRFLVNLGKEVQLISVSATDSTYGFFAQRNSLISKNIKLLCFSSFGHHCNFLHRLDVFFVRLQVLFYFLFLVPFDSTLIVYHSLSLMRLVTIVRKLKKIRVILETEEIYGEVSQIDYSKKKKEYSFLSKSDGYIFCVDRIRLLLDPKKEKSALIYGSYRYFGGNLQENKRIVFSGSLGNKMGAEIALSACAYLDSSFEMSFLLFGDEKQYLSFLDLVQMMRPKVKCRIVVSNEILQGDDFYRFLSSFQVGIAVQKEGESFDKFSFPSKILAYLSCDLNVVVNRLESVEASPADGRVFYAQSDSSVDVARTIVQACATRKKSNKSFFEQLNSDFASSLSKIIN